MDQGVTFRDLLAPDPGQSAGDVQRRAAAALPQRVRQSSLIWWPDRADINATGHRLVIGVAAWSLYDLRLLDLVNDAVAAGAQPGLKVAVFNVDELSSPAELERIFTGIGTVYHTPAVGYWAAGQLKETASGFDARQLVARLLGFDPNLVLEQPAATTR